MLKKIQHFFHKHYNARYHGVYRHAKKLFVFDIFLLVFALTLLGASLFFFFWNPGISDLVDLNISLGGERIRSGDEIKITIEYANRSKQTLINPILGVRLPPGFVINRAKTPEDNFSNNTFKLADIDPGATGAVEIHGRLWTDITNETNITALLSYQTEKSPAREQKLSNFIVRLPSSVLTANLLAPDSIFPNTPISFAYDLKNTGTARIERVNLSFEGAENAERDIVLEAGEEKNIRENFILSAQNGEQNFKITAKILINGHWLVQNVSEKNIKIFSPNVYSEAKINSPATYAEPGQKIPVEISWKNQGPHRLKNLKMRLIFPKGMVDLAATAKENRLKLDSESIYADSTTRTALSDGSPNQSDFFVVNVILAPTFNLESTEQANFQIIPIMEGELSDVPGQVFKNPGIKADMPLATEVTFKSEARYYTMEGDQLGRGPLPPIVGETTKYWIFIQIINTSNQLTSATFQTALPEGVTFTGKQSVTIGPHLKYDPGNRAITWNHSSLPANSLTGLYFEVAVTPTADQIGKNIQLTQDAHFTAQDNWTGKNFSFTNSGLTNNLKDNDEGSSKGAEVVAE